MLLVCCGNQSLFEAMQHAKTFKTCRNFGKTPQVTKEELEENRIELSNRLLHYLTTTCS